MIISVAYPCSNPDVLWETNVMPKCQWSPWNAVWNILDGRILKQTGRLLKTLIETVFLVRFFTRNYRSLNTASCRVVLSKGFWFNSHLGSIYIVFCWSVENREMMLYNIHVYIIRYYDICIYIYRYIYHLSFHFGVLCWVLHFWGTAKHFEQVDCWQGWRAKNWETMPSKWFLYWRLAPYWTKKEKVYLKGAVWKVCLKWELFVFVFFVWRKQDWKF